MKKTMTTALVPTQADSPVSVWQIAWTITI